MEKGVSNRLTALPISDFRFELSTKAAIQRCSYKKVFLKYAVNLQENTLAWVLSCKFAA